MPIRLLESSIVVAVVTLRIILCIGRFCNTTLAWNYAQMSVNQAVYYRASKSVHKYNCT